MNIPWIPKVMQTIRQRDYQKQLAEPGWVTQLVRVSSQYAKVVGLTPRQGKQKNQPINA